MESVIVVMDANRNKGNADALDWALNRVVRPKDTVIVLGIICEFGKKTSCFPFYMGIGISAIWERLEFSGQGEMTPKVVEEEIATKREQYQCTLQPFYRQCKKNEVKLEVKLAAGFDPRKITIEEAKNSNTRWIVLDSHLKKHKAFIYEHTGCNVAAMKEKNLATITLSRATGYDTSTRMEAGIEESCHLAIQLEETRKNDHSKRAKLSAPPHISACWFPLSWRTGFPRNLTQIEIGSITDGFSNKNILLEEGNVKLYKGILMETPVLVKCYFGDHEQFWSELQILSRVRHRNFSNLVGYCCTDSSMFLLRDYSGNGSLDMHLQCDELAKNLNWKSRGQTQAEEHLPLDVHAYGLFLLELLTGQKGFGFGNCQEGHSLEDWVLPLLENGVYHEVIDSRLMDSSDAKEVHYMACAALLCFKRDYGNQPSISEVLAAFQGDGFGAWQC
ncbi:hypothetical protein IFM89_016260 [Coptis chinensis]|uniref:non-specific serine/threonine protein kinase n=1 Tax=Coptis chinensis TaxID=261450 RepID=A0A835LHF6_9MAGN|nr:hypothetical protein IFM89_016260 [Coptis chinensis]